MLLPLEDHAEHPAAGVRCSGFVGHALEGCVRHRSCDELREYRHELVPHPSLQHRRGFLRGQPCAAGVGVLKTGQCPTDGVGERDAATGDVGQGVAKLCGLLVVRASQR